MTIYRMTRITYRKSSSAFPPIHPLIFLVEEVNKSVQLGIMSYVYVDTSGPEHQIWKVQ